MTIEEFDRWTREVEAQVDLKPNERFNLGTLRRTVAKHGNVAPIEILLVKYMAEPASGYVVQPKPRPKPKAVQQALF